MKIEYIQGRGSLYGSIFAGPKCRHCRYWDELASCDLRNVPSLRLGGCMRHTPKANPDPDKLAIYPLTDAESGCGEGKLQISKKLFLTAFSLAVVTFISLLVGLLYFIGHHT